MELLNFLIFRYLIFSIFCYLIDWRFIGLSYKVTVSLFDCIILCCLWNRFIYKTLNKRWMTYIELHSDTIQIDPTHDPLTTWIPGLSRLSHLESVPTTCRLLLLFSFLSSPQSANVVSVRPIAVWLTSTSCIRLCSFCLSSLSIPRVVQQCGCWTDSRVRKARQMCR